MAGSEMCDRLLATCQSLPGPLQTMRRGLTRQTSRNASSVDHSVVNTVVNHDCLTWTTDKVILGERLGKVHWAAAYLPTPTDGMPCTATQQVHLCALYLCL